MKESRPKTPVTLEDLLRLKRAEKPDAAFWAQFEQEFRAKQLAAAVERRRWWFSLPRFMPQWVRLSVPVGATAVLALTFVSLREQAPSVSSTDTSVAFEPVATEQVPEVAVAAVEPASAVGAVPVMAVEAPSQASALQVALVDHRPAPSRSSVAIEASMGPVGAVEEDAISANLTPVLSPSARLIAANMAEAEIEFAKMLHRRETAPRVVEEPLAQIAVPSSNRTARVLPPQMAQLASYSLDNERSPSVTERQARRLSEDQFYDAARRLSAQADRLMLKL